MTQTLSHILCLNRIPSLPSGHSGRNKTCSPSAPAAPRMQRIQKKGTSFSLSDSKVIFQRTWQVRGGWKNELMREKDSQVVMRQSVTQGPGQTYRPMNAVEWMAETCPREHQLWEACSGNYKSFPVAGVEHVWGWGADGAWGRRQGLHLR